MDTLEQINRLIDNYEKSIGSQNLSKLLELRDRLSVWTYRLAQEATEFKKDYNTAYFIRKISVSKSTQGILNNKKVAFNKASLDALVENEDIYKEEQSLESACYTMDLLLRQSNKILEAMAQRISYLKTEKENVRKSI
jgi:hypothetical protein